MYKTNWKDAPEWAKYLAMDEDGEFCWFEDKPHRLSCTWQVNSGRMELSKRVDWRESMEQRP